MQLKEAVALHQFQTDANDMEAWILETLRQVSSQEVGHDEFSTQTLARKQREVEEEIQSHRTLIDSLHEQALGLPPVHANSPQVSYPWNSIPNQLTLSTLLHTLPLFRSLSDIYRHWPIHITYRLSMSPLK